MTSYTMPLAALALALAVRVSGVSVDEGALNARILVGALSSAVMFITIFVVPITPRRWPGASLARESVFSTVMITSTGG
ncbi:hypothetical protein [Mesorhizobium sp.]|uniref:hypothetical protein n=1 Tax=Mesorhizobium sp. TaxID=1871066 RepID=UPI0025BE02D3|nr:hypothetical protein [Mesorhizobium sp.]